ncbi:hypothetical protein [Planktothrix serta]|nr:hypothetical protein [Planktothrix serta]
MQSDYIAVSLILSMFIETQKPGFFRNISVIQKKRSQKPGFSVRL